MTENKIKPGETNEENEELKTSPETGPEQGITSEGVQEAIEKKVEKSIGGINKTVLEHEELEGEYVGEDQVPGIKEIDSERSIIQEGGTEQIKEVAAAYQLKPQERVNEDSQLLDEHEKLQAYIKNEKNKGTNKKEWELVLAFLQTTKEEYNHNPTIKRHFDKLVNTESFQKIQGSSYVRDNYEDLSIDEYLEKKEAITEAAETTDFINKAETEFIAKEENSKNTFNSEYDLENLKPGDAEKVKGLVRNAEFNGINDQKKLERMFDKGIISSQDVVAYLNSRKNKTDVSPFQSLASFSDAFIQKLEITDKLKDEAKKELDEPLDTRDTKSMSSIIFQKILAAETLHQSEQVQIFYKMINDTIRKVNDSQNLVTSFFAFPNEKLFNSTKINQTELKKLFLKYIDECKQNKSALKQGHLTNLIKAKQKGYISDKEYKTIYPDKV